MAGTVGMHYLQMMYTYAPAWGFGGPTRLMYDYARWFVDRGDGADVIAGDLHHDYTAVRARTEVLDGICIRRVRVFMRRLVRRALNLVSPSMLYYALRYVHSKPGITAVHIAELRSPVFLYAAIVKRLAPRRVILVHSAFGMLHDKPRSRRRLFDPLFMGFMLRSVDIGLAQNVHEVDAYHDHCRKYRANSVRIELLPLHTHGPPAEVCSVVADEVKRLQMRERHGLSKDAFVCIFLGRLHSEKGILRTIDAFEEFAAGLERPACLLIVGRDDGFEAAILAHIRAIGAADRIRIVGGVYEQRFEYYALSDLFLGFPTIYEETMLASVEALSCATPVLVSREAHMPFVEDEGAGFVIDFTQNAAVAAMRCIAKSPKSFRENARQVAVERFAQRSVCSVLQAMIGDVALHGRSDRGAA